MTLQSVRGYCRPKSEFWINTFCTFFFFVVCLAASLLRDGMPAFPGRDFVLNWYSHLLVCFRLVEGWVRGSLTCAIRRRHPPSAFSAFRPPFSFAAGTGWVVTSITWGKNERGEAYDYGFAL